MTRLALLATAALLTAAPALAQTQPDRARAAQSQASRAEVVSAPDFVRMVSMSDRFETAASRLAQERSQNADVKRFAEHMVRDHMKTTQELQKLQQGVVPGSGTADPNQPLPNGREQASNSTTNAQGGPQPTGLDAPHQQLLQQLQQANGAAFDRLYVQQQVQSHQQAVDLFRNYAAAGDNAQLRQWATQTLPSLEEHLREAQRLERGARG